MNLQIPDHVSLDFTITHRPRVTRRLHLELDDNGGLVVVVPRHWPKAHVRATLARNISHVESFMARARKRRLAPLEYLQGGWHLYLGERYPLAIKQAPGNKARVMFKDEEIRVCTQEATAEQVKTALQNFYRMQALQVFSERIQRIAQRASWARDRTIPLKLRRMKRTWGNCSAKGVIKLNTHLIKAPLLIIDSVITHELCHLAEMNHGRKFYRLLASLNPNWRQDRAVLRAMGHVFLL